MILCGLEPGLLIFEGLDANDRVTALSVIRSLTLHSSMLRTAMARIPVTQQYLARVYEGLNRIPIKPPPIEAELRKLVIEILANQLKPALTPTGVGDSRITHNVISDWIKEDTRALWCDCILSALMETYAWVGKSAEKPFVSMATWGRQGLPRQATLSSEEFGVLLGLSESTWDIPLLVSENGWNSLIGSLQEWPAGLQQLIDAYAADQLGIPDEGIGQRKAVRFEPPCSRQIAQENDPEIQRLIVEVIACRAYDRPEIRHHDETLRAQRGIRRVTVKKMDPPVRLHYYLETGAVVYILYSNGEHDEGL